jgi:hypothetical protein
MEIEGCWHTFRGAGVVGMFTGGQAPFPLLTHRTGWHPFGMKKEMLGVAHVPKINRMKYALIL